MPGSVPGKFEIAGLWEMPLNGGVENGEEISETEWSLSLFDSLPPNYFDDGFKAILRGKTWLDHDFFEPTGPKRVDLIYFQLKGVFLYVGRMRLQKGKQETDFCWKRVVDLRLCSPFTAVQASFAKRPWWKTTRKAQFSGEIFYWDTKPGKATSMSEGEIPMSPHDDAFTLFADTNPDLHHLTDFRRFSTKLKRLIFRQGYWRDQEGGFLGQ